jgi:hypothetical protein
MKKQTEQKPTLQGKIVKIEDSYEDDYVELTVQVPWQQFRHGQCWETDECTECIKRKPRKAMFNNLHLGEITFSQEAGR